MSIIPYLDQIHNIARNDHLLRNLCKKIEDQDFRLKLIEKNKQEKYVSIDNKSDKKSYELEKASKSVDEAYREFDAQLRIF